MKIIRNLLLSLYETCINGHLPYIAFLYLKNTKPEILHHMNYTTLCWSNHFYTWYGLVSHFVAVKEVEIQICCPKPEGSPWLNPCSQSHVHNIILWYRIVVRFRGMLLEFLKHISRCEIFIQLLNFPGVLPVK